MLIVPDLENEAARLRILAEINILDSPPDRNLDDITELAASICSTPIALITLIDHERQWFKSRVGLDIEQTPRDFAFCVHALASAADVFVVADAQQDDRFRNNPLVTTPPFIRFYAGAPLVTSDGIALGTLCVIDRVPRVLASDKLAALQALRRYVVTELEQRRTLATLVDVKHELEGARDALARANDELQDRIDERTASLAEANRQLVAVVGEQARIETELRRSEARFRATFSQAAVGIAHVAPDGHWLAVNERLCEIVGYTREALLTRTFQSITHPADLDKDLELSARVLRGEIDHYALEKRYLHQRGHDVWINLTVSLVRDADGEPDYLIKVVEDIGARVAALQRLRHAEARLRSAVEVAALGYLEWNLATDAALFSPEYARLLGYGDASPPSRIAEWETRLHPDDRARVRAALSPLCGPGASEQPLEFRLLHCDGNYRWIAARAVRLGEGDDGADRILITHLDVSDSKNAERRVREAALHDPLTGLPNRALVFEYASHILASSRRSGESGAIMFLDLDRFKTINDTYGHRTGDAVLQEVGRRLRGATRAQDIVGRIGGDEFLVILPSVSLPDGAANVARHLLDTINAPIRVGGLELYVSPSIGICALPRAGAGVGDLVRYSDLAMYRAKRAGQNRFEFFSEGLEAEHFEALSIEKELKLAVLKQAFRLHYQPILDLASGELVSVEALLRWPGNAGPAIGPSRFIPIAEAAGIIAPLSQWAIGEACRQHRRWIDEDLPPIAIALNVSPAQFQAREFSEQFRTLLGENGVDSGVLQVEVTESMLMQDVAQASSALMQLKELGCKVALDDFGTGYSSLAYLSQLPLDKLKVDQSFVRRLDADPACAAITEAIIALGRTLKLQVVAEGIETAATMERVRGLGCEQGQGYFFSPPLSGEDFVAWYAARE